MPRSDVSSALDRVVGALPQGGEAREGQRAMAQAVARAIQDRRHLVVEAGTGTGKSLAYLVPAILSGKKVIVATATKALQDQLASKDLPFLARHLGHPFRFAVLKGRSNYLCRQRAAEVAGGAEQLGLEEAADWSEGGRGASSGETAGVAAQVRRLVSWAARSPSGDRAELDFEPRPQAWAMVSVGHRECPGAHRCPSGETCFTEAARERAAEADVIVVNTHLYGSHLASGGAVLPEHDVVIFDEAHEVEDVVIASFGTEVAAGRFRALSRLLRAVLLRDSSTIPDEIAGAGDTLETALERHTGRRVAADMDPALAGALEVAAGRLARATSALRRDTAPASDESAQATAVRTRALLAAGHLADDVATASNVGPAQVAWVEGPTEAPVLKVAPLDVGPVLAEALWARATVVLTSATIPPGIGRRLGVSDGASDDLDTGSPFPYSSNAMLYCAAHLPDRRLEGAEAVLHDELEALIEAARGRTLALFTSWRAMEGAAKALRERIPFRLLTQSELPKPALIEAFSSEESSCLFATLGFWQGVDVPGPALSLVVIDRIPFPRPDEPFLQARRERFGQAAFREVDLPRAATLLAQGAGRLIRSASDRGVVAVLDSRLAKASYRWELVEALPPMTRTRHLHDVAAFLTDPKAPQCGMGSAAPATR
ncbi:MAG TPA: ATP-dependent DNA helicase [Acidimicrobiales bacterium]|nr:ATP-dependent DNA helicase [Acidimicrobiales bacterium]